jgi:hypothetical protein
MQFFLSLVSYVTAVILLLGGLAFGLSSIPPGTQTKQRASETRLSSTHRIAARPAHLADGKGHSRRQAARKAEKVHWATIQKRRTAPTLAAEILARDTHAEGRTRYRLRSERRNENRRMREFARRPATDAFAFAPAPSQPQWERHPRSHSAVADYRFRE